jgi:hypothetical protein
MIEKRISNAIKVCGLVENTKIASFEPDVHIPEEVQNFAANLQADPRFAYMHAIAMSDGDSYGSNMNGDVFTWDELTGTQGEAEAAKNKGELAGIPIPRFKTFEQAKFFKHHANSDYDKFYGDVPLAAINEPMRRIELIIRVARQDIPELNMVGAPDVCLNLDNGIQVCLSMGSRISHEQCNYCGATNEFISQRCPHLATQMGEIMPNGVKVAALNYGMRFFDISKVTIPADPIAFSLNKVASIIAPPNKAFDVEIKKSNWRQKWSEIYKEIPSDAAEKVECGEFVASEPIPFEDSELQTLAKTAHLNSLLNTASALGIVFAPYELMKLALYSGVSDVNEADVNGINVMSVDYGVANLLKNKVAERSGYFIAPHNSKWQEEKFAGYEDACDFYAFYRTALSCVPVSDLTKSAAAIPAIRDIVGRNANPLKAASYLAHTGY